NRCTDPGVCKSGECIQPPTDCSQFDDGCHVGVCNPENGCHPSPREFGTACDDGFGCTDGDQCDGCGDCFGSTASSGFVCRDVAGNCDMQEVCDGTSVDCPSDSFVSSLSVCRTTAGVCDVAEHCTGSTADCPPDSFASATLTCRTSGGV